MKSISILGCTGSIGRQTLAVVEALTGQFRVVGLAAGSNLDELVGQIERHRPELVSVATAALAGELAARLREKGVAPLPAIHHGREGMLAVGTHAAAEIVVSAAVGVVGLEATYEAIKLGKVIALSNKEVLVAAGELAEADAGDLLDVRWPAIAAGALGGAKCADTRARGISGAAFRTDLWRFYSAGLLRVDANVDDAVW